MWHQLVAKSLKKITEEYAKIKQKTEHVRSELQQLLEKVDAQEKQLSDSKKARKKKVLIALAVINIIPGLFWGLCKAIKSLNKQFYLDQSQDPAVQGSTKSIPSAFEKIQSMLQFVQNTYDNAKMQAADIEASINFQRSANEKDLSTKINRDIASLIETINPLVKMANKVESAANKMRVQSH